MKRLFVLVMLFCMAGALSFAATTANAGGGGYEVLDCDQTASKTCAVWQGSRVILKANRGTAYLYDDPNNPYQPTRIISAPATVGCAMIVNSAPDNPGRVAGAVTGAVIGPRGEDFYVLQACPGTPQTWNPPPSTSSCYYDGYGNWVCPQPGYPTYPTYPTQPTPCYTNCQPTGTPPASDRFTYKGDGVNVPGGTTYVSAAANEMVVFTTGPLTYSSWSFYGQRDGTKRGTILILIGPIYNEPVFMEFGGWKGTYVARYNVAQDWLPVLDQKIWDMRHYGNCSDPYNGCQFLDNLVVERAGTPWLRQIYRLDNPLRTY